MDEVAAAGSTPRRLREHDVEPVERPQLEFSEEADGRPSRVKATVEVRPAIALGAYKGIAVPQAVTSPSPMKTSSAAECAAPAKERATLVPVRAARAARRRGHRSTTRARSTACRSKAARGESQIDGADRRPLHSRLRRRHRRDERRRTQNVETDFPANYADAELAGKAAQFDVDAARGQGIRTSATRRRICQERFGPARRSRNSKPSYAAGWKRSPQLERDEPAGTRS